MYVCLSALGQRILSLNASVIASYLPANPGPVRDLLTGKVVAQHEGLWNFTIGQNARVKGMPEKMFVAHKDNASNSIYVVAGRCAILSFVLATILSPSSANIQLCTVKQFAYLTGVGFGKIGLLLG